MADALSATGAALRRASTCPTATGAVCVIEGGIADNVVPEDCRFHYEFRNLPGSRRRGDAGAR